MGSPNIIGSSVSIVSDDRLDDRDSILCRGSYIVGTGRPFPGVKGNRGVTLTTASSAEVRNE
jgi:hypothetical protein